MKKKNISIIITTLFSLLLCVTPTFAKYYGSSTGVLWETLFTEYTTVATEFKITDPNGDVSNNLWGLGKDEENPELGTDEVQQIPANNEYLMNNLEDVKFSAYNASGQALLVCFTLHFYIGGLNSTLGFVLKNIASTNDANNITGDVTAGRDSSSSELFEVAKTEKYATITGNWLLVAGAAIINGGTSYTQYKITINPVTYFERKVTSGEAVGVITDAERTILEDYFVLFNNQKKEYNISTSYDNALGDLAIFNSYSSIAMEAVPYNG